VKSGPTIMQPARINAGATGSPRANQAVALRQHLAMRAPWAAAAQDLRT
jgi:hypothetical protein